MCRWAITCIYILILLLSGYICSIYFLGGSGFVWFDSWNVLQCLFTMAKIGRNSSEAHNELWMCFISRHHIEIICCNSDDAVAWCSSFVKVCNASWIGIATPPLRDEHLSLGVLKGFEYRQEQPKTEPADGSQDAGAQILLQGALTEDKKADTALSPSWFIFNHKLCRWCKGITVLLS